MVNVLLGIMAKLAASLATEAFAKHLLLRLAKEIAKKTENTVDDDVVKYISEAWGIEESK